jgi:hypothetical protein
MKINKNPTPRDIRQFVLLWALFASIGGALLRWRHHSDGAQVLWMAAAVVGFGGLVFLPWGRLIYRLWMGFAAGMNFVVTRFLLTFIFVVILTPLGIFFKLIGRDALRLKKTSFKGNSYWIDHEKTTDPAAYQHLY